VKPSRYNLLLPDAESGGWILFNTLYGSLSTWSAQEISALRAALSDPASAMVRPTFAAALAELKYLVPEEVDELEIVRKRKRAGVLDPNRLDVTIMPTLECNFACPYCYETRQASHMSEETQNSLCRWLEREIPGHKLLHLTWFGGEPLLERRTVAAITAHAQGVAQANGVATMFNVTTNGYLLTPERARELIDLGILDYQITIDGPKECHDRMRVLRSGHGTFDRVLGNVVGLARQHRRVTITLRVNFNHLNLSAVPELLSGVPADIRPQLSLSLEPVFGSCLLSATANMERERISASLAAFYYEAFALGFDVTNGAGSVQPGKLVYCDAEREHQYLLNFNGDVFKCGVSKFASTDRVGYLDVAGEVVRDALAWSCYVNGEWFEPTCEACVHLPLCMGGCRAARLRAKTTGTFCTLVPTNTQHLVQQVARGRLPAPERATASALQKL